MSAPITRGLLSLATERDKQRLAGPSSLANPCDACVARELRGDTEPSQRTYWLGAVIGTAIHGLIETRVQAPAEAEIRLTIGEIPGYGTIKGTADYYEPGLLGDWKSTTRKKLPAIKKAYDAPEPVAGESLTTKEARAKLKGYLGQTHLYGRAAIAGGREVQEIVIEFICRDGTGDNDIVALRYPYDPEFAEAVWNRVLYIWDNIERDDWESDPYCYTCST